MNSAFDRANLSVILSILFIRLSEGGPQCFSLVKQQVVLAVPLFRGEPKIFVKERDRFRKAPRSG
jgi:hypothetical protein